MAEPERMEKVVRKFASFEEADKADDAYYASLTNQQCLDIMVELVGRVQRAAGGRLERVCRIIKLKEDV